MTERPDVLVLGGGGRHGETWMGGLLAGIEDTQQLDLRECDYLIGTSAGAVLAARLASGQILRRPAQVVEAAAGGHSPTPGWAADSAMALAAPLAQLGLRLGRLPGELLRLAALRIVPPSPNDRLDFAGAFPPGSTKFDGRLRLTAVDRATGRRVVFGAPGAPRATVPEALAASCAVPLIFPAAVIGGREYVDGAVWSPTNADATPAARGMTVLIVAPMASRYGPFNSAVRAASRAAALIEAAALKARGAHVRIIAPDRSSSASMGGDLMSAERLSETHAAGYAQGLGLS